MIFHELEHWIQRYYNEIREPSLRTELPSSRVMDKVYAIKSELGSILFLTRGTLDTIAGLLHFLYGPSSAPFKSFGAFVRYLNQSHAGGADADPAMRGYIEAHLKWFQILREYRDYVTHYGSRQGILRTYLQDATQVHDVVAPVLAGLDAFCEFVDRHFTARITGTT